MVSTATILCCVITLLISLVFPVLVLALFAIRCKKQGIASAWALGAAGFVVTQLLIRIPILSALQGQRWFLSFAEGSPFLYAFTLAFTAGLFELAGRFGVARLMQKNLTPNRGLAAGLGHGGIEAMVLIGITYINNLAYIAMINSGTFPEVLANAADAGVDVSQLELIGQQLTTMAPGMFLLAGFERLLTMIAHTAMSLLVCYGAARKKILPCCLVCLGIHTALDLTAGISMLAGTVLRQNITYTILYAILTAAAVFSLYVIRELHRRWNKEVPHVC